MSAGPVVHRYEAVHSGFVPLLRPFQLGDVVVHLPAHLGHTVHHPPGLPERRDEEPDAFLERLVYPALHSGAIVAAGLFDQRVEADGLSTGEPHCQAQAGAELVSVHVGERNRLDDSDASGSGNRANELRVAARVHGAADERHADARVAAEFSAHAAGAR
jgi:hypothetical protein